MCVNEDIVTTSSRMLLSHSRLFIPKLKFESKIYVLAELHGSTRGDMNDVLPLLLVVDRRSKRREKERVGGMPAGGGKITEIAFVLILRKSTTVPCVVKPAVRG